MKKTHFTSITLILIFFVTFVNQPLSTATLLDLEDLPNAHLFSGGDQNIGNFYAGLTFGPDVTGLVRGVDLNDSAYPPHSGDKVIFTDVEKGGKGSGVI